MHKACARTVTCQLPVGRNAGPELARVRDLSMRPSKISTIGPAPVAEKSWCSSALATTFELGAGGGLGSRELGAEVLEAGSL